MDSPAVGWSFLEAGSGGCGRMFCKKFGSEIPEGSKVCPACGNPLAGTGGKKPPKKKKSLTGWIVALSILLVLSASALAGSLALSFQQEGAEDVDATVPASYLNEAGFRKRLILPRIVRRICLQVFNTDIRMMAGS